MSAQSTLSAIASVEEIISEIRAGRMVILVDDEDRENEGDLILAADHVSPEAINFMATHARGLVCLTITEARSKQLGLTPMARDNNSAYNTAFTTSIEAAEGVSTGISAHDRSRTVQVAMARHAKPEDIVQPGHTFPIIAKEGGVLVRAGHTEAGCDLARLAGCEPASVICEILKEDGSMARLPDLIEFAQEHGLKIGTIADLIHFRSSHETLVERSHSKKVHRRTVNSCCTPTPTKARAKCIWRSPKAKSSPKKKPWCASMSRFRCSIFLIRRAAATVFRLIKRKKYSDKPKRA